MIAETLDAVKRRGIIPELVSSSREAPERITQMIPEGAELMTGAPKTLEEVGFVEMLKSGAPVGRSSGNTSSQKRAGQTCR